jgi:uncharacterized protein YecT (DUF1311 family)
MIAPPPIHETFTLLPCPAHQVSNVDMEGCGEHVVVRTDRQIDGLVRTIYGLLRTKDGRTAFVRSEAFWLDYRRTSCTADASAYTGGTLLPVEYIWCLGTRNRTHIGELQALRTFLAQH